MPLFTDALHGATCHPTDRTTRELGLKALGDLIEFGIWQDPAELEEVVAHLVDRAMAEDDDEPLRILALHTLQKVVRFHPDRPREDWPLGHLAALLQYAGPLACAVTQRTLALFGRAADG